MLLACMTTSHMLFADGILSPNLDDEEYFSETFTLFADLNNGAYIYGQIGVSNIGPGNERGVCRLLVSVPNKDPINHSIIVDKKEWFYSEGRVQLLQVKSCRLQTMKDKKRLEFYADLNQQKIKIVLHDSPKKHKTPFNRLLTSSGYYQSDILVPWAGAEVEYTIDGKDLKAKGYGYADHSRATLLPAKLAYQWVRFRGINGENSKLLLARQSTEDKPFEGWSWWQKNTRPEAFQELKLKNINKDNVVHWNIAIKNKRTHYQIKTNELLLRYAPMEEKGVFVKMVSFFVGNPVTYTYRAKLIAADGSELPGILEVSKIDGK